MDSNFCLVTQDTNYHRGYYNSKTVNKLDYINM